MSTPKITDAHRALAEKINNSENYTSGGVPEVDIAQWLAEHDAALTARIAQLESERDNWRVSSVARDAVARAEAAESLVVDQKRMLEKAHGRLVSFNVHLSSDPILEAIQALLDKSPDSMASVIAELREEVESQRRTMDRVVDLAHAEKNKNDAKIARLSEDLKREGKMRDNAVDAQVAYHRRAEFAEAQRDALIRIVVPHIEDLRKTASELSGPSLAGCLDLTAAEILIAADELQAAVSGASSSAVEMVTGDKDSEISRLKGALIMSQSLHKEDAETLARVRAESSKDAAEIVRLMEANKACAKMATNEDKERMDFAHSNPELVMSLINSWWTNAGRGFREVEFNFRGCIDAARQPRAQP